jgi:hypothetical protein
VSLCCFASGVFRFCDRTTGARVGVGKGSPVVVWLGPPRIAAWVIVLAGGQGAGSSLAAGGSPFLDSSSTTVEDEDEG